MNPELEQRIARIASDRESGASAILADTVGVLRDALSAGEDTRAVAAALRAAQPSMAGVWNATAAALDGTLEQFAQRAARAGAAIARFTAEVLETGLAAGQPLSCVTVSYSGVVALVLETMAQRRPVRAACAEGRPALEGRRLAQRLAGAGVSVAYYADAAIAAALPGADAVLVGADALADEWFVNKAGTLMIAAAAGHHGVPVYVLAGREKVVAAGRVGPVLLASGDPGEVWETALPGIDVRNPYFERVPLRLATALVTDGGVRGT